MMMTEGTLVEETDVASLRMRLPQGARQDGRGGRRQRDRRQRRHLLARRRELHQVRLHGLSEDLVVKVDDRFPFVVVSQNLFVDVLSDRICKKWMTNQRQVTSTMFMAPSFYITGMMGSTIVSIAIFALNHLNVPA